ncbi:MAG: hypothetical protein WAU86_23075 [Oricola sp.]
MANQRTDYTRLLRLQRVMKSLRERDLTDAKNRSAAAERALDDLDRMIVEDGPIARLFPDLLAGYFQSTLAEKSRADQQVSEFSEEVLKEKRKLEAIEDRHAQQRISDRNRDEAAAQSETIDQRIAGRLSASSKFGKIG